ncbi:MAG: SRPBCC family protein [Pseudobdellovibrionaceae bacterium]|nr:SRPBCC family protein [Pseudobdellovibrionaceae bacterium]
MNHDPFDRPTAKSGMLIRKPGADVFEAFINPDVTTRFWFTHSSGRLEAGQHREWRWDMYDLKVPVWVKLIDPHRKIVIEWGEGQEKTTAEWTFKTLAQGTYVEIINYGFQGTPDEIMNQVADSTGGFHLVLAGLKAYLEHNIRLNLIADRFPEGLQKGQ